jgi:hypothetical protein
LAQTTRAPGGNTTALFRGGEEPPLPKLELHPAISNMPQDIRMAAIRPWRMIPVGCG